MSAEILGLEEAVETGVPDGAEGVTRAGFLARTALAAGTLYGAAAAGPLIRDALAQEAVGDIDVIGFLIGVNRIEAEMYDRGLREASGLSGDNRRTLSAFREHEHAHIRMLERVQRLLNGPVGTAPQLDFGDRLSSERSFLLLANQVEDIVVQSGVDAAQRIKSKDALAEVAKMLQVESRHAAAIATRRGSPPAKSAFEGSLSLDQARQELRPLVV
jgi:hypothetical protein